MQPVRQRPSCGPVTTPVRGVCHDDNLILLTLTFEFAGTIAENHCGLTSVRFACWHVIEIVNSEPDHSTWLLFRCDHPTLTGRVSVRCAHRQELCLQ